MSSGVGVNPECLEAYQSLKLRKQFKSLKFQLSKDFTEIVIDDSEAKDIAVDETSEDPEYEKFVNSLPANEPRWAVYDFGYETADGKRNKLIFISWIPEPSKIKARMVHAASKDALRRSLVGIAAEIQATDYDEVSYQTVFEKVSKGR